MITWGSGKKPSAIYTSTNFWIGKRWSRFVSFARKRQIGDVSIALPAWHIVQNVAAPHTAETLSTGLNGGLASFMNKAGSGKWDQLSTSVIMVIGAQKLWCQPWSWQGGMVRLWRHSQHLGWSKATGSGSQWWPGNDHCAYFGSPLPACHLLWMFSGSCWGHTIVLGWIVPIHIQVLQDSVYLPTPGWLPARKSWMQDLCHPLLFQIEKNHKFCKSVWTGLNQFHRPQKTGPRWSSSVPTISGSVLDRLRFIVARFGGKKPDWTGLANTTGDSQVLCYFNVHCYNLRTSIQQTFNPSHFIYQGKNCL